jgi:hypothetical protein
MVAKQMVSPPIFWVSLTPPLALPRADDPRAQPHLP